MRYEVELADEAAATLQGLPIDIALCVNRNIEKLAEAPLALGRRAAFPFRPVGQVYQFWCEEDETYLYYMTIFFHFLPGETTLKIFTIGTAQYRR